MTTEQNLAIDFDRSLQELERLVEALERGELPLEDALAQFERGVELARTCQTALQQAEQKVEQLLEEDGQLVAVPYESQDSSP